MEAENKQRIIWLDIAKAILILLVVVGHSTGLFNGFIYLFHISAFFILSGFSAKLQNKNLIKTIYSKFVSLYLPFFSCFLVGAAIYSLCNRTGFCLTLFGQYNLGFKDSIIQLLTTLNIEVQFLGPGWFIITLFFVSIIQKLILLICQNKVSWGYLIINLIFYLVGYALLESANLQHLGSIFIAGGLFSIGSLLREKYDQKQFFNNSKISIILRIVLLLAAIGILIYFAFQPNSGIDFASYKFNSPILDLLKAISGTLLVVIVSSFLEKLPTKLSKSISFIGKNSLGILLLHLWIFKIIKLIFYWAGAISVEDVWSVVPSTSLGNSYWWLFTIVSMSLSTLIWWGLTNIKFIRFFFGGDKKIYNKVYNWFANLKPFKKLGSFVTSVYTKYVSLVDKFLSFIKQNIFLSTISGVLLICICCPLYNQAIMCNDELISRFYSIEGSSSFFNHFFNEHAFDKGRILSAPFVTLTMYLGFLGSDNSTFKILQIVSILLVVLSFAYFLYALFRNKKYSIFASVIALIFIPITFENTAPNAFNTLYNFPFAIMILSFAIFINYLRSGKASSVVASSCLFFFACLHYETFVCFAPLFLILSLRFKASLKDKVLSCLPPIGAALLYLILYFVLSLVFPGTYGGNQITSFDLSGFFKVLGIMFISAIPTVYLFNPKYQYLYQIYSSNIVTLDIVRIVVLGVCAFILILKSVSTQKTIRNNLNIKRLAIVVSTSLLFMVLPSLPLALSSMYQENALSNSFAALPTSFFSYFASILLITYVLFETFKQIKGTAGKFILSLGICCFALPVAAMNTVISNEQAKDFERLQLIESFISSQTMKEFSGYTFSSTDLYKTNNALAINDGYWTNYSNIVGVGIDIQNNLSYDNRIYFDDEIFTVWIDSNLFVASKEEINNYYAVQDIYCDNVMPAYCVNPSIDDTGWNIYSFSYSNGILTSLSFENIKIGSTFDKSVLLNGAYQDGWMTTNSSLKIKTKDEGKISLELYTPYEITGNENIKIFVNDSLTLNKNLTSGYDLLEFSAPSNQVVTLRFETNFTVITQQGELRTDLSFIVVSLNAR